MAKQHTELFLEIDHNLKSLQYFCDKLWGDLETCPMSVAYAFEKNRRVMAEIPSSKTVHAIRKDYYLTEAPNWHRKIFNSLKPFGGLSDEVRQGVLQFYGNLGAITSNYKKLKTSGGTNIIQELEIELKAIATKVLEQGNPLKGTQVTAINSPPPDDFLLKARLEVQVIYDYIKKHCNGLPLLKSPSELKYKKALECFQEHKKSFEILTIKDLGDKKIYVVTSKADREIIGRILDKIVSRKNYKSNGAQKLFIRSQSLLKKTA